MKQPCYLGLEDARQVLAEMGVKLSDAADATRGGTGCAGTTQAAVLRRSHRAQTQNREGRSTERVFQTAGGSAEKPAPKLNWNNSKCCIYARFYCMIRYGGYQEKKRQ